MNQLRKKGQIYGTVYPKLRTLTVTEPKIEP